MELILMSEVYWVSFYERGLLRSHGSLGFMWRGYIVMTVFNSISQILAKLSLMSSEVYWVSFSSGWSLEKTLV